jgi:hypothetical protein
MINNSSDEPTASSPERSNPQSLADLLVAKREALEPSGESGKTRWFRATTDRKTLYQIQYPIGNYPDTIVRIARIENINFMPEPDELSGVYVLPAEAPNDVLVNRQLINPWHYNLERQHLEPAQPEEVSDLQRDLATAIADEEQRRLREDKVVAGLHEKPEDPVLPARESWIKRILGI